MFFQWVNPASFCSFLFLSKNVLRSETDDFSGRFSVSPVIFVTDQTLRGPRLYSELLLSFIFFFVVFFAVICAQSFYRTSSIEGATKF